MNQQDYIDYMRMRLRERPAPVIFAQDVDASISRTLAYGYDTERRSWHVYTYHGEIHAYRYRTGDSVLSHVHGRALPAEKLRPSKRVYPDTVDKQFALLMLALDHELPFLGNFDFSDADVERRARSPFFGARTHLTGP